MMLSNIKPILIILSAVILHACGGENNNDRESSPTSASSPTTQPIPALTQAPTPTAAPVLVAERAVSASGLIGCVKFEAESNEYTLCANDSDNVQTTPGIFSYTYTENAQPDFPIRITQQPEAQQCLFENNSTEILFQNLTGIAAVVCTDQTPNQRIYLARNNYSALLEPKDTIRHCLGSSETPTLDEYSQLVSPHQPSTFIDFIDLANVNTTSLERLRNVFAQYRQQGHYMALQVGLNMTVHPDPTTHYEQDVASGLYDKEIQLLAEALAEFGHPVYLRIGVEFNGWEWMGYEPETYKAAFIRVTNIMREASSEIATVWHAVSEGITNNPNSIAEYYPGDEYVDWWALSLFNVLQFNHPSIRKFLDDAHTAGKPVMIAESTARGTGTEDGLIDWFLWFHPFFDLIANEPGIKMMCYINWDWNNRLEVWSDWGNARVQENHAISVYYKTEISHPIYQHSDDETTVRPQILKTPELTPPTHITNFNLTENEAGIELTWDDEQDNIQRYDIYVNDELFNQTTASPYQIRNTQLTSEQDTDISIVTVDIAGNQSARSETLNYMTPNNIEKITNGNFEQGIDGWIKRNFNAGDYTLEASDQPSIAGNLSGKITITEADSISWHMQLSQLFSTTASMHYRIQYTLKANTDVSVTVGLQQVDSPYEFSYIEVHNISANETITIDQKIMETKDDYRTLTFMLGDAPQGSEIIIDDVSVLESRE